MIWITSALVIIHFDDLMCVALINIFVSNESLRQNILVLLKMLGVFELIWFISGYMGNVWPFL